jgi:crotonobetainyl-CoA:carnitine CoA-transferase CaiB-like acyl-CoA transferase
VAGTLEMLASPILVDGKRLPIRRPPPTLGQHTEEGW